MSLLCRLAELDVTGAKELIVEDAGLPHRVFVVRNGDAISAFFNACPHARLPLNAKPDSFFDAGRSFLVCVNHGAHFDASTGRCIRGPCKGESLRRFDIRIDGDAVLAADPDFTVRA